MPVIINVIYSSHNQILNNNKKKKKKKKKISWPLVKAKQNKIK